MVLHISFWSVSTDVFESNTFMVTTKHGTKQPAQLTSLVGDQYWRHINLHSLVNWTVVYWTLWPQFTSSNDQLYYLLCVQSKPWLLSSAIKWVTPADPCPVSRPSLCGQLDTWRGDQWPLKQNSFNGPSLIWSFHFIHFQKHLKIIRI